MPILDNRLQSKFVCALISYLLMRIYQILRTKLFVSFCVLRDADETNVIEYVQICILALFGVESITTHHHHRQPYSCLSR
jgi:hypothetical protein